MTFYLAGPLFTEQECDYNIKFKYAVEHSEKDVEVRLPQDNPANDSGDAQLIHAQDIALLESCDALIALCNGPDVDSGTAFEIGYACAKNKPVIIYRRDKRPYLNCMIGGMPVIVDSIEGIANEIEKLLRCRSAS